MLGNITALGGVGSGTNEEEGMGQGVGTKEGVVCVRTDILRSASRIKGLRGLIYRRIGCLNILIADHCTKKYIPGFLP